MYSRKFFRYRVVLITLHHRKMLDTVGSEQLKLQHAVFLHIKFLWDYKFLRFILTTMYKNHSACIFRYTASRAAINRVWLMYWFSRKNHSNFNFNVQIYWIQSLPHSFHKKSLYFTEYKHSLKDMGILLLAMSKWLILVTYKMNNNDAGLHRI